MGNKISDYKNELKVIFGWSVDEENGKPKVPLIIFPDAVADRIKFFVDQMGDGLLFTGALNFIFAYDEERDKQDCEEGGEWLPVSDEFKEWRDKHFADNHEIVVALGMMYGYLPESEAKQKGLPLDMEIK
ncbi:hypothetical protein OXT66_03175 [Lentilactobacillus senioris]|uniref:hypothetical protein n=1 Tax=Lentilactobacillus senioris TaxID=931534 RepID=UPI00228090CA|nr:hypothetical protein [Lentilactobacillus senioris]MCY9806551.1 hypothetical protein [Lentilactobacillus senioris]